MKNIVKYLQVKYDEALEEAEDEFTGDKAKWAESVEDSFYKILKEDGVLFAWTRDVDNE